MFLDLSANNDLRNYARGFIAVGGFGNIVRGLSGLAINAFGPETVEGISTSGIMQTAMQNGLTGLSGAWYDWTLLDVNYNCLPRMK